MSDYMVRAEAADLRVRAFAATTRDLAEYARNAHNTSPVATAALGRLLTAGAMMGTTMKGEKDLLTLIVTGDGPIGKITVTSDASGRVKGYVANPEVLIHAKPNGKLDVSGAVGRGDLKVIKDIGLKDPYVGQIELISGELAEDITYYYAVSEQTPSSVGLGVLMNKNNTVKQAGGFIIQLMPDAGDDVITYLEEKLSTVSSVTTMLDAGMTPEDILQDLLGGLNVQIMEKVPLEFYCNCSKERVEKAIISIGAKEVREMAEEKQDVEVRCQFCNTAYVFSPEEMMAIADRLEEKE